MLLSRLDDSSKMPAAEPRPRSFGRDSAKQQTSSMLSHIPSMRTTMGSSKAYRVFRVFPLLPARPSQRMDSCSLDHARKGHLGPFFAPSEGCAALAGMQTRVGGCGGRSQAYLTQSRSRADTGREIPTLPVRFQTGLTWFLASYAPHIALLRPDVLYC